MSSPARPLPYSSPRPLTAANQALPRQGIYRLLRQGQLIYVGETNNLRSRLMKHLLCLTHFQITPAPYQFQVALTTGQTQPTRRRLERRIIGWHQRRGRLPQQREFEEMLAAAATELEQAGEYEWEDEWARTAEIAEYMAHRNKRRSTRHDHQIGESRAQADQRRSQDNLSAAEQRKAERRERDRASGRTRRRQTKRRIRQGQRELEE